MYNGPDCLCDDPLCEGKIQKMKCRIEGCESTIDFDWGSLGHHLSFEHGFSARQLDEYGATHSRDLWLEAHGGTGKAEMMILKVWYFPDEATREGLIHVLSEVSGAIVSMEEIKR